MREAPEKLVVRMWLFPYLTWATIAMIVVRARLHADRHEHDGRETVLLSLLVAAVVLVIAFVTAEGRAAPGGRAAGRSESGEETGPRSAPDPSR